MPKIQQLIYNFPVVSVQLSSYANNAHATAVSDHEIQRTPALQTQIPSAVTILSVPLLSIGVWTWC
jgi:hypothetical protein